MRIDQGNTALVTSVQLGFSGQERYIAGGHQRPWMQVLVYIVIREGRI